MATVDVTTWEYWWLYNKDAYVDVRARLDATMTASGLDAADVRERVWDQLGERILPPVLAGLGKEQGNDPTLAAMFALARVCDGAVRGRAPEIVAAVDRWRADPNQAVAEGALLSLGVLGHESSVQSLCAVLRDAPDARRALGGKEVPERSRAFAAYALGLLGSRTTNEDVRRFAVHHLVQRLLEKQGAHPDSQAACVIALGMIPLSDAAIGDAPDADQSPSASLGAEVGLLEKLLQDADTPLYVRAHLPKSLVRLTAGTRNQDRVTRVLLDRVTDRSERTEVVHGSILALGSSQGSGLDAEVRDVLVKLTQGGEAQARCFAMLALAQIGARNGAGEHVAATRALLLESLATGRSVRERTWSALALGVLEHGTRKGAVSSRETAEGLARGLRAARSPEEIGALAIGCGLAKAQIATPILLDQLASVHDSRALSYVTLALGMLEARQALEPLHTLLDQFRSCPVRLPETALALALLEDSSLVTRLLALLEAGSSQATKQAAIAALGAAGDRRVVDSLLAVMLDDSNLGSTRGAAITALGRVCDRDSLPWQHAVSADLNYRAMVVTLSDANGSGLLDLN
jgi:HEAT repeat protein